MSVPDLLALELREILCLCLRSARMWKPLLDRPVRRKQVARVCASTARRLMARLCTSLQVVRKPLLLADVLAVSIMLILLVVTRLVRILLNAECSLGEHLSRILWSRCRNSLRPLCRSLGSPMPVNAPVVLVLVVVCRLLCPVTALSLAKGVLPGLLRRTCLFLLVCGVGSSPTTVVVRWLTVIAMSVQCNDVTYVRVSPVSGTSISMNGV